jgi:hypothetical protein
MAKPLKRTHKTFIKEARLATCMLLGSGCPFTTHYIT